MAKASGRRRKQLARLFQKFAQADASNGQVQRILQKSAYTREALLAELRELVAGVTARPRTT